MIILPILAEHYPHVAAIYLQGIKTKMATFQQEATSWQDWDKSHLPFGRLVAILQTDVVGWCAITPVSNRCVYAGVGEVSIYVAENQRGRGIGKLLLQQLIVESEKHGIWTLQSGIFPENVASISLHQQCGFRMMGHREKIGKLDGVWRDNVMMERRSKLVGV